ncbi:MAG: iron-containing alcohol dehydrogenase [Candidatus Geothermincolia bacterium]
MALREYYEFCSPTKVMFGQGLTEEVGPEAEALGATSAMIITDRVIHDSGMVGPVIESIEKSELDLVEVYTDVPINSEVEICMAIAELGAAGGVDLLISVGGGSVIDTAKGVNILLGVGGDLLEDWQGTHLVPEPLKKHIAIPTTAGTGAEASLGAVIKHTPGGVKVTFNSKYLLPDVAILDPLLTVSMPPGLTAATGIDALTHAVEAFTSLEHMPPSDAFCTYSIQTIFENLRKAVDDGEDLEARGNMLIAANLAGNSLSHTMSIGACHAMAHAAGGLSPVSHGVANAIILPTVMRYNMEEAAERFAALAPFVGVDPLGLDELESAQAVIDALVEFIYSFGLPRTLREAGADAAMAERMTEEAMGDGQMYGNPREADFDEILALYSELLS